MLNHMELLPGITRSNLGFSSCFSMRTFVVLGNFSLGKHVENNCINKALLVILWPHPTGVLLFNVQLLASN